MKLFGRKKAWDEEQVQRNKDKMRGLFNQVVEDSNGYHIVYGVSQDIKIKNYIVAKKTMYLYTSLIIGFRESDMSLVFIQTEPELDGCSNATTYTMDRLKKAEIEQGSYKIYFKGGLRAGYLQFYIADEYDEDYTVYTQQPDESSQFLNFWNRFVNE